MHQLHRVQHAKHSAQYVKHGIQSAARTIQHTIHYALCTAQLQYIQVVSSQVIIQCPSLEKFDAKGCTSLEVLMLWSDKLTKLDITDSKVLV